MLLLTGKPTNETGTKAVLMKSELGENTTSIYPLEAELSNPRAITVLDQITVMMVAGETRSNLLRVHFGDGQTWSVPTGTDSGNSGGPLSITHGENFINVGHEMGTYLVPFGE